MLQRFWQVIVLVLLLSACAIQTHDADDMPMKDVTDVEPMDNMMDTHDMDEMEETMEGMMPEDMEERMEQMVEPDVTFSLKGENFKFLLDGVEAPELHANVGDLVRIELAANEGFHDWVVDEFDARTERVRPDDGMTSVEFRADTAGTFEYYCSVGSHRANGMKGNLVVS